jgi:hypothetical protein
MTATLMERGQGGGTDAIEYLTAALAPDSARQYRGAARHFLIYLGEDYPGVRSLDQLRRDPHVLGWFARLRLHTPALGTGRLRLLPAVSAVHSGGACLDYTAPRSGSSDPSRGHSAHSTTSAPPVVGRVGGTPQFGPNPSVTRFLTYTSCTSVSGH